MSTSLDNRSSQGIPLRFFRGLWHYWLNAVTPCASTVRID